MFVSMGFRPVVPLVHESSALAQVLSDLVFWCPGCSYGSADFRGDVGRLKREALWSEVSPCYLKNNERTNPPWSLVNLRRRYLAIPTLR